MSDPLSYHQLDALKRCYVDNLAEATVRNSRDYFKDDAMMRQTMQRMRQLLPMLDMDRIELAISNTTDKHHDIFKFCQANFTPKNSRNIQR